MIRSSKRPGPIAEALRNMDRDGVWWAVWARFLGGSGHRGSRESMELLVYVRNHAGPRGKTCFVGASVGTAPKAEQLEVGTDERGPITSMAEFRVDARIEDPVRELRAAVAELFTVLGSDKFARPVYFSRTRSALKVKLEPGFECATDVERELAEMLSMCSPRVREQRKHAARVPTIRVSPVPL